MRFALLSFIILLCAANLKASCPVKGKRKRSPVILIPGLAGSQLEVKNYGYKPIDAHESREKWLTEYSNIWLNPKMLIFAEDWNNYMSLEYNNVSRTTKGNDKYIIRPTGWGTTSGVEFLGNSKYFGAYFNTIADMLVATLGYVRNISLCGAPYDFRRGPNESEEFFLKLKVLVEEMYKMNDMAPVTLIAHSMGGLMSMSFLKRNPGWWKKKYISKLITLGTPWGGSIKSLKTLAIGDDFDVPILHRETFKPMMTTFPSLAYLLPSPIFWKDIVLVQTQNKSYTVEDLQQFLTEIKTPNAWEFAKDNEKFHPNYVDLGVEFHCLYGVNVSSVARLDYKPGVPIGRVPELIYGDGDGTVNINSLEGCLYWKGKQTRKIYTRTFRDINHSDILSDKEVLTYLATVLQYDSEDAKKRVNDFFDTFLYKIKLPIPAMFTVF